MSSSTSWWSGSPIKIRNSRPWPAGPWEVWERRSKTIKQKMFGARLPIKNRALGTTKYDPRGLGTQMVDVLLPQTCFCEWKNDGWAVANYGKLGIQRQSHHWFVLIAKGHTSQRLRCIDHANRPMTFHHVVQCLPMSQRWTNDCVGHASHSTPPVRVLLWFGTVQLGKSFERCHELSSPDRQKHAIHILYLLIYCNGILL